MLTVCHIQLWVSYLEVEVKPFSLMQAELAFILLLHGYRSTLACCSEWMACKISMRLKFFHIALIHIPVGHAVSLNSCRMKIIFRKHALEIVLVKILIFPPNLVCIYFKEFLARFSNFGWPYLILFSSHSETSVVPVWALTERWK